MNNNHHIYALLLSAMLVLVAIGCANKGIGPQGGPKDETPPKVVKESPVNGSVNYKEKTIEITFDEYLQLNDIANQVLISPPQQRPPEVRALGKRVIVTFDQDLKDSTTYTIDFGNAICDLNERNPYEGYSFSFATGPEIDTLQVGGILIDALTLNPVGQVTVGIHSNMADSAFERLAFDRIGRTNADGEFTIKNIHRGDYRLYALNDISKDYVYETGEGLAVYDSIVTPTVRLEGRIDTLYMADSLVATLDSLQLDSIPHDTLGRYLDTIVSRAVAVYEPSKLVLRYFEEDKQRHYFTRCLRDEQHLIRLLFAAPNDSLPVIVPLTPALLGESSLDSIAAVDSLVMDSISVVDLLTLPDSVSSPRNTPLPEGALGSLYLVQPSLHNDTISIWLTDSAVIRLDTLSFLMTYMVSDSVYNLVPQTDTVTAIYRAPRLSDKAKAELEKKKKEAKQPMLKLSSNASQNFEIFDSVRITVPSPVGSFDPTHVRLCAKVDTLFVPIDVQLRSCDQTMMSFIFPYAFEAEKEYQLEVDSAAFRDVYGLVNGPVKTAIKVRSLEDYATLIIKLKDFNPRARIQILNSKDEVVRELPASEEGTRFEYLKPETYYMRLYLDENADGRWTTGDWTLHRQPEPVYYFSGKLTLRANWDFEETFDHLAKPILEQKPAELVKKKQDKKK